MGSDEFQEAGPVLFISSIRIGKASVMEMARTLLARASEIKKNMKKPAFKDIPARRMKEMCLYNIYDGKNSVAIYCSTFTYYHRVPGSNTFSKRFKDRQALEPFFQSQKSRFSLLIGKRDRPRSMLLKSKKV